MKRNEIIAIVAVVVVAGLVWLGNSQFGKKPQLEDDLQKTVPEARVIKQDAQTTLSAFPAGFPVEEGAQNTDSYKYIPASSLEQQSTLDYVSKKSLADNARIFRDYLSKSGFAISNRVEEPDLVFYYATKGAEDLSIKIKISQEQEVSVSASYLRR